MFHEHQKNPRIFRLALRECDLPAFFDVLFVINVIISTYWVFFIICIEPCYLFMYINRYLFSCYSESTTAAVAAEVVNAVGRVSVIDECC